MSNEVDSTNLLNRSRLTVRRLSVLSCCFGGASSALMATKPRCKKRTKSQKKTKSSSG